VIAAAWLHELCVLQIGNFGPIDKKFADANLPLRRSSSGPSLLPMAKTPAGTRIISQVSFESAPSDDIVRITNIKPSKIAVAIMGIRFTAATILRKGGNIGKPILFGSSCYDRLAL
jgi:hypothetical protein